MSELNRLPQVTGRGNSPVKSEKSSVQKALDDRLLFSEATDLASTLLDQFPNAKNSADGFIGSIANILGQYPRQVSLKCADPLRGVARHHDFLTINNLVSWCEKETEPLRMDVVRENRRQEQLRLRDEWKPPKVTPRNSRAGEITYKEFLDRSEADGKKPRPLGAFEKGGYLGPIE